MRTTITLADDLHAILMSVSQDKRQTISRTIEELLRKQLKPETPQPTISINPRTGWPLVSFGDGRVVTVEDVRSLDDDE